MVGSDTEHHRTEEDPMTTTTTGRIPAVTAIECVRRRRRTRALAIMAAVGATLTVWTIAHPVARADLVVDAGSGPTTVTPAAVVLMTVVAGLAAWGLLALVDRFTRRAAAVWSWIACAVLLISLLGPIGSAVGAGATAALVAMHLVTGAVPIPIMARSSVQCRRAV
jgi:Family of unknown function (DUF6069)